MTTPSNDKPSLEDLLAHVIVEYQLVDTSPSGIVLQDASTISKEMSSLRIQPLCAYENGFPFNYGEFHINGVAHSTLFPWFVRTRLRYSCSTLAVSFARFLAPKLDKLNLEQLYSTTINQVVKTTSLDILTVLFTPQKQHSLELVSFLGTRTEIVENLFGGSYCNHNALKCRETGIAIDLALGQFTGTMKPYVFMNEKEWVAAIPGQVALVFKTQESDIQGQMDRDNAPWRIRISPDAAPARFAKRVLKSLEIKKPYCGNCFGIASAGTALKRCSKCQQVYYCSRHCQVLHWKVHKQTCRSTKSDSSSTCSSSNK